MRPMKPPSITPQDARARIQEVFRSHKAGQRLQRANEAATRLLVIDEVLVMLGWPKDEFCPEMHTGAGDFIDYLLPHKTEPWMVVEAKRHGTAFDLPEPSGRGHERTVRSMRSLLERGGGAFRDAAKQAAGYCNDRAVPLACVTNGYRWVFFRGLSRAGRTWQTTVALVFRSPDDILARFDDFWMALARPCAGTSRLLRFLDRHVDTDPIAAQRPMDCLAIYKPRLNPEEAAHVRAVCDSLLGDIYGSGNEELLDRCYVEPGAKAEFESSIARLLKDTSKEIAGEHVDEGNTHDFVAALTRTERLTVQTRSPIVVAGHVGAGKTTFIHRSLARLRDGADAFFALADLEGRGLTPFVSLDEENLVSQLVLERLSRAAGTCVGKLGYSDDAATDTQIDHPETLRALLRRELESERAIGEKVWSDNPALWHQAELAILQKGRSNSFELLVRFIRHLRGRFKAQGGQHIPALIVLDNLDQASDEYQRCIYGLAQRIARDARALVVICLREDTYARAREPGGFLTSSPLQFVFHVQSPPIDRVLRERVKLGRSLLDDAITSPQQLRGVAKEREQFMIVLSSIDACMLSPKSPLCQRSCRLSRAA